MVGAEHPDSLHRKDCRHVDLVSYTNARLANPLGDLTDEEVMKNAAAFAKANGLPVEAFLKGGLVAKRPDRFEHTGFLMNRIKQDFAGGLHTSMISQQCCIDWSLICPHRAIDP